MQDITTNERACRAFIEALRRSADTVFCKDEIVISQKMKIGDPVVCTMEAEKGDGSAPYATGKAYVYSDLVIVCVESVWNKFTEPVYPHHYEYLGY
jgi:hypothetical protein